MIASLIAKKGVDKAIVLAKQNFSGLPFNALNATDLESNVPTNSLWLSTFHAPLGGVDAFVSHSWHDDAHLKWNALQLWASNFRHRFGREPTIWLDKACINQSDIQENLSYLPIFLAGCSELLILAGSTYTSRLWCVMELFIFLRMGGSIDRITLIGIGDTSQNGRNLFKKFDAQQAQCFLAEDRDHLLAIIESGFGSLSLFSDLVRHIFSDMEKTYSSDIEVPYGDADASFSLNFFSRTGDDHG
eukprot:gnl/MRDRNA2_/MRDRNA2_80263_c1_seq1.p1 gnl/MRDRNA2_/MRDRNA2_80263_c1~~gnl/MRDRNA2_/MRDRNA2_80263_c1_seq1.p1  ORF type:complete len:270 (-),score=38.57 gnl/MRDRNA2_/MRDRNA2_80263_c1_seq1:451-1185(-)